MAMAVAVPVLGVITLLAYTPNPASLLGGGILGGGMRRGGLLDRLGSFPASPLEQGESLEQLRWLSAGLHIQVQLTDEPTVGIDTPEDLARISQLHP